MTTLLLILLCSVVGAIWSLRDDCRTAQKRIAKLEKLLLDKHEAWRGERFARLNAEVRVGNLEWELKHGFSAPLASPYCPWGLRSPQAPVEW